MVAVQEFWGKEKNFTMEKKHNHFSGQLGFVLAAAGSAVGVGNLWRFPYLAAKDGGGLFLIIYFILVLTFGFTLLTSDIAIGRRTQKSAIGAYEQMRPKWKGLGILTFLVPVLIMTYYAVIGGWITKYAVTFLTGQGGAAAEDGYFTAFITSPVSPVVYGLLFMGITAFIVYNGVALLAGAMIIPAVYVFSGTEGMSAGPSLMFVSLPKVFAAMGPLGTLAGILFFVTAIFATLTSCISVLESIAANVMEIFHMPRKKAVLILSAVYLAASAVIALGYSRFYLEIPLPNGSVGQLLDLMDYISNSVMMPFIALLSTILIGWIVTPDYVIDELQRGGTRFRRKKLYRIMIRYVAPVMMLVLFLQSTGILR